MDKIVIRLLRWECGLVLRLARGIDNVAKGMGQENEQWFLNYQDKLNHISVL